MQCLLLSDNVFCSFFHFVPIRELCFRMDARKVEDTEFFFTGIVAIHS